MYNKSFEMFRFRGWRSQARIPKRVLDLMTKEEIESFNKVIDRFDDILADIRKPLTKGYICNECREKYYLKSNRKIEITNYSTNCYHCNKFNSSDLYYEIGDKK